MKKDEKITNQSYESDGVMGKEINEDRKKGAKEEEFFNITPESE